MLTKDQIAADLACVKLGHSPVSVTYLESDYGVGVTIHDSRFTFINEWFSKYELRDMVTENDEWYEIHLHFHQTVQKALAKQGIVEGNNKIYVGKNVITVELKDDCCDEAWYTDTFGPNHKFEYYYSVNHDNNYAIDSIMNMSINHNQLLEDYLRYTDSLVLAIKKKMKKMLMHVKKDMQEYFNVDCTLNELGLDYLNSNLDQMYKNYKI